MTGRNALHHGLDLQPYAQPEQYLAVHRDYVFLPRLLQAAGYRTAMLGKWHLGFFRPEYTPVGRGFEEYLGYLSGDENYTSHFKWPPYKGGGIPDLAYITDLFNNTAPALGNPYNGTYSTLMYAAEAERIVRAHAANATAGPLYLYLALQSTHSPYTYLPEYFALYPQLPANSIQRRMHAMVSAADAVVQRLVAALRDTGLWDNTLLVLHSDNGAPEAASPGYPGSETNGGGSAYPYRGQKFTTWEGGTHTPAIVAGGWLPPACAGGQAHGLMHVTDWYRTFGEAAGVPAAAMQAANQSGPHPIDGFSALAHLQSCGAAPVERNESLYWFRDDNNGALRVGRWKLLMGAQGWNKYCWTPNYTDPHSDGQVRNEKEKKEGRKEGRKEERQKDGNERKGRTKGGNG